MGQITGERHIVGRLIGRVAIHDALIATTQHRGVAAAGLAHAEVDIRRLLMHIAEKQTILSIQTAFLAFIANIPEHAPGCFRQIDLCRRGNLSGNHQAII